MARKQTKKNHQRRTGDVNVPSKPSKQKDFSGRSGNEFISPSQSPISGQTTKSRGRRKNDSSSRRCFQDLFPRHSEWVVFVVTLCVRLHYVSNVENWWILHPDEIFQSVEVAHSELYGYGFRPYEYMPPLDGANSTASVGRQQENALGMYSLRSFMYPQILVVALYGASLLGYTGSPLLFWKMFHTVVTSSLPLAVFAFTKVLYGSRDVAVMASVLTSTSVLLSVLATHTLVNSFVSPFMFWSLVALFKLLVNKDNQQPDKTETAVGRFRQEPEPTRKTTSDIRKPDSTNNEEELVDSKSTEKQHFDNHHTIVKDMSRSGSVAQTTGEYGSNELDIAEYSDKSPGLKFSRENCNLFHSYALRSTGTTHAHGGIICELFHHCKKLSPLSVPYLSYESKSFLGGNMDYLDAPTPYYPHDPCDKRTTDLNHNGVHKSVVVDDNGSVDHQLLNQNSRRKSLTNQSTSETPKTTEAPLRNCKGGHSLTYRNLNGSFSYDGIVQPSSTEIREKNTIMSQGAPRQPVYGPLEPLSRGQSGIKLQNEIPENGIDGRSDIGGSQSMPRGTVTYLISGVTLALCVYIRADLLLFVSLITLPFARRICKCYPLTSLPAVLYCIGIIVGLIIGVVDDYISYGHRVISPWQWLTFNVIRNKSGVFFGTHHWSFYIRALVVQDEALSVCLAISVITFVAFRCQIIKDREQFMSTNVKLFISLLTFFISHSLNSHKEVRFLHDFVVLLLIFYSSFIVTLINTFKETINQNGRLTSSIVVLFVTYLCSSQWRHVLRPGNESSASWAFRGTTNTNHVNVCLDFLRQQDDVTGVFIDTSIHVTGAFATLHKNVPVIALIHNEFYEFDMDSRLSLNPTIPYVSRTNSLSLSVLAQASDFISVYNTPYLLKTLIRKPVYNYLVLPTDRQFIDVGFREIFRSGNMRILKRSLLSTEERQLMTIERNIPLGQNTKILNYEANWLLTFGLYDKSISKLMYSLELDKTDLQSYQLLMEVKRRQGDVSVRDVFRKCGQYHGHRACSTRPGRIVIHNEYDLKLDT